MRVAEITGQMSRGAAALMAREARIFEAGRSCDGVPDQLGGETVAPGRYRLFEDAFLVRGKGFSAYYKKGCGVCVALDDETARPALDLVLGGSMRVAIAAINGLFPFHASAIAMGGRVFAFAGPSGAGKSTLVAALMAHGVPIYCDDTLLLDWSGDRPVCLPGHKRLRLWPDAVALAGVKAGELVSPDYRKYYCSAHGNACSKSLPLGGIIALARGAVLAFERLHGAQRIAALADDHYSLDIHRAALGYRAAERLDWLGRLAACVPVYRFTRPLEPDRFAASTDFMAQQLKELAL